MSILKNYSDLQDSIADWLNRDDLTSAIRSFIALAEAIMVRKISVAAQSGDMQPDRMPQQMLKKTTLTLDSASIDMPDGFLGGVSFTREGGEQVISYATPNKFFERSDVLFPGKVADTEFYTVLNNNILLWPEPSGTDDATMIYVRRPDALSNTNPTNWLLTDHPDIYLYGALMQAAPYLKDDPRIAVWQQLFEDGIATLCGTQGSAQKQPDKSNG